MIHGDTQGRVGSRAAALSAHSDDQEFRRIGLLDLIVEVARIQCQIKFCIDGGQIDGFCEGPMAHLIQQLARANGGEIGHRFGGSCVLDYPEVLREGDGGEGDENDDDDQHFGDRESPSRRLAPAPKMVVWGLASVPPHHTFGMGDVAS